MLIRNFLIVLLIVATAFNTTASQENTVKSKGSLSFQCNGEWFHADSIHARAYALKHAGTVFINGANADNMIVNIQAEGINGKGTFVITEKNGRAEFTINHKTYFLKGQENYIKMVVSQVKLQGTFLLLSGTFDGLLQDKNGNKIKLAQGLFETAFITI